VQYCEPSSPFYEMNKLLLSIFVLLIVLCIHYVSAVHVSVDVELENPQHHHPHHHVPKHHNNQEHIIPTRPIHALAEELTVGHSAPKPSSKKSVSTPKPVEHSKKTEAELNDADPAQVSAHKLPDPDITPGNALSSISLVTLCKPGYTTRVRDVPQAVKNHVYRNYGISANNQGFCKGPEGCEVDHLISLELGGSNDISNLWPQPYFGATNAHNKDQLENKLHSLVCAKKVSLSEAQQAISDNWIEAYNKYIGPLH